MRKTTPTSAEVNDLIQTCDLLPSEDVTRRLLEICSGLNQRIDELNAAHRHTANIASCLANGIQPD